MSNYGIKEGERRFPSDGGTYYIDIVEVYDNGTALVKRNDGATKRLDCFKINTRYCFVIEPGYENIGKM